MNEPGPVDIPFDFDQVKQRAHIRRTWLRGKIGNPIPWCHYCKVVILGEFWWDQQNQAHHPGCDVPDALNRLQPDFDALVAEVERLRGRYEP
jgi:hypothetical protein